VDWIRFTELGYRILWIAAAVNAVMDQFLILWLPILNLSMQ